MIDRGHQFSAEAIRFTMFKSDPKIRFHTKIKSGSKIGFMLKAVCVENFELILDILDRLKPSISSFKPPGRLAACYLENTPLFYSMEQREFLLSSINRKIVLNVRFC